ncbi:unnamed protein product [Adineta steineri]|uniref:Uncharacterized protein n=1 Tax=Adineta steineri TaxID=433720 RepID=A0A813PMT5_9BILA|nr:unnamed protein product [Adineta steineri]CAF0755147.1 unnamed protein product [Adineta steineri]CAF0817741.1 unnamed protein product [Adineta steineri]CAF0821937.1 unnamed protein product [Adineta steineri]CAF0862385.1 unnamed protein product [Adineta steineri]
MPRLHPSTLTTSRSYSVGVTTANSEQSLGPNLQSRLEALEAAMGVRLNLAKRQGRHSLSNTTSPSPMQLSPTSTAMNTTITNSLSLSSRHNIPLRSGQGIQRSASSCDVENRPGPIKRLKPSLPIDNCSSTSIAASIATVKNYPPPVRRPVMPTQTKQSTPIKQRLSPMDTSSPRLSRSSTTSTNSTSSSSNYRTPIGGISPKLINSPSPKRISNHSLSHPPINVPQKRRLSIFGEQFSDDILKRNLLWIDIKEFDDESHSEIILQFGSIENFLSEQQLFFTKQQYDSKLAAQNKTVGNRSRFYLSLSKKDRLELL